MNIVFLDSNTERRKSITKMIRGVKHFSALSEAFKDYVSSNHINILFLSAEEAYTLDVVEWIIDKQPIVRNIIIHTDVLEATTFNRLLRQAKYSTAIVSFNNIESRLPLLWNKKS